MASPARYRAARRNAFDRAGRLLPPISPALVNYLTPGQPREVHHTFDNDGPGALSPNGSRHDNDHIAIKDVQVLPTMDEILATARPPYMPLKNVGEAHFLPHGPSRLLDTLFRYLRYDSTESMRDICYTGSQILITLGTNHTEQHNHRQETPSGNHFFIYYDVKVEEVLAHERKGVLTRVSYTCPKFMRGNGMYDCAQLEEGMLCALIGLQQKTGELSITFFDVLLRQSTFSMDSRGGAGTRAAVQLALTDAATYDDVLLISRHAHGAADSIFALIEFPKVLLIGFYWCLRRLQEMREDEIAFTNYISPHITPHLVLDNIEATMRKRRRILTPLTPAYTQDQGFKFDLSCLAGTSASFSIADVEGDNRDAFYSFLRTETGLDSGQANAFIDNITREVSFTQGPPGTGKTYLGIALARVLLASRNPQHRKPILVVCLTNHALDSFLAGLRNAGLNGLIRVGGGSKEEWTNSINLRGRAMKSRLRQDQRERKKAAQKLKQDIFTNLDSWCKDLSQERTTGELSWHSVQSMLRQDHVDIYKQLMTPADSKHTRGFVFDYWARGGDIQNLAELGRELRDRLLINNDRKEQEMDDGQVEAMLMELARHVQRHTQQPGVPNVWEMDSAARNQLLQTWTQQLDREHVAQEFASVHLQYQASDHQLREVYNMLDAKTLLEHDVIGMTTTACASRRDLLQALDLEIMICEEAGQVMEAHSLISLLPTLQHAIFIGDPLQLRPEVAEQHMSLETAVGRNYRLDESLFERFMIPSDPAACRMPTSQLNVQRRMHPEIADITRLTYPLLTDHISTLSHPKTAGLVDRVYWVDHRVPELEPTTTFQSHVNAHEVAFVTGLVKYLLRGSEYSSGDIAVLTPYNGQLAALHESLQSTCKVWLNEKDREALLDEGLLAEQDLAPTGLKDEIQMSDLLRVATVDNFQGEEAKVVIMTTVRSGGRPGFLKTVNRINVACSRARDGFYIVGNAVTLHQVPRWRAIINVFERNGRIGPRLSTCCDRHPQHAFDVQSAEEFDQIPECDVVCDALLDCGHRCMELCHSLDLHSIIPCRQSCDKLLACEDHHCPGLCFEKCGPCEQSLGLHILPCGHEVDVICLKSPKCEVVVDSVVLKCGHLTDVQCFESRTIICKQRCQKDLHCGHQCAGLCRDCSASTSHTTCKESCGEVLECGRHHCDRVCHPRTACPPCDEVCGKDICVHGPCKAKCKEPCEPCVQPHVQLCGHQPSSRVFCCLPSDIVPCSNQCCKALPCGHACPGLCGEVCLTSSPCSVCEIEEHLDESVVFVPTCQHYNDVRTLDQAYLSKVYTFNEEGHITGFNPALNDSELPLPACFCGLLIPDQPRYHILTELNNFSDTMDRLVAKIGRMLYETATTITRLDHELQDTADALVASISANLIAAKSNKAKLTSRGRELVREQKGLSEYRTHVIDTFESSLQTLHTLFPQRVPAYLSTFSHRFSLLEYKAAAISIKDSIAVSLKISSITDPSQTLPRQARVLQKNAITSSLRYIDYCQTSIDQTSGSPVVEVQLRIQQHYFHLLADCAILNLYGNESRLPQSASRTIEGLAVAAELCNRYPDTAGTFATIIRDLQQHLSRSLDPATIPATTGDTANRVESAWSNHVSGSLTLCVNSKHFFSTVTFPSGCAECGRRVERMDQEYKAASQFLFEEEFLRAMRK